MYLTSRVKIFTYLMHIIRILSTIVYYNILAIMLHWRYNRTRNGHVAIVFRWILSNNGRHRSESGKWCALSFENIKKKSTINIFRTFRPREYFQTIFYCVLNTNVVISTFIIWLVWCPSTLIYYILYVLTQLYRY